MTQRGFTLLEAMVVVVILAVLAAVTGPSLGTWMDNVRIRNVADALQQGLQTARAEAIKRNQPISFWLVSANSDNVLDDGCDLDNTSASWVVSASNPNSACGAAPSLTSSPQLVESRAIGDIGGSVVVAAHAADGTTSATSVTFNGFGRMVNPSTGIARINVTGPNTGTAYRNLRLTISTAGQVRLCDPNVTSTTDPRRC